MLKIRLQYSLGETVYDTLTRTEAKIVGIQLGLGRVYEQDRLVIYADFGVAGYWLDNDYLSGGRHPWEIEPVGRWKLFWYYLPLHWSNFKASLRNILGG